MHIRLILGSILCFFFILTEVKCISPKTSLKKTKDPVTRSASSPVISPEKHSKMDEIKNEVVSYGEKFTKSFHDMETRLKKIEEYLVSVRKHGLETQKGTELILEQIFRPSCYELAVRGPPPFSANENSAVSSRKTFSGVYTILPPKFSPIKVKCESGTDGDGWTVILSRSDGTQTFNKTFEEYRRGFGDPANEYYIGNDALHVLTTWKPHMLRIEMEDFSKKKSAANYFTFRVSDIKSRFLLTISDFDTSCRLAGDGFETHNGMEFSTYDKPPSKGQNCALQLGGGGGWWYSNCYHALGTGEYRHSQGNAYGGVAWWPWHHVKHSLKAFKMMIRPSPQSPTSLRRSPSCSP